MFLPKCVPHTQPDGNEVDIYHICKHINAHTIYAVLSREIMYMLMYTHTKQHNV